MSQHENNVQNDSILENKLEDFNKDDGNTSTSEERVRQINKVGNLHLNSTESYKNLKKLKSLENTEEDKHKFAIREIKNKQAINNNSNLYSQTEINNLLPSTASSQPVDRLISSQIEINNSIDSSEKFKKDSYTKTSKSDSFPINLDVILSSSAKLIKTNEEFFYLVIFLGIWLGLILFEFIYGFVESKVHIISDSFFNYFKTFSFLITGFSILLTRVFTFDKVFLKNRIELISALSNCVFLIIVSLYMCLQALHLVTEPDDHEHDYSSHQVVEKEEQETISFFKNFYILKVIADVIGILVFSDYIVHPSIQIKLLMWKKQRSWKNLAEIDLDNLKESRNLIKMWNNHFENMNALTINILSDLIASILFLICFYVSKDRHFEGVYCLISIVNLFVLIVLMGPILNSIIKILMQGRSELYECFYNKLHKEISYFEGCVGIKDLKFWMTAQNDIKCNKYYLMFRLD